MVSGALERVEIRELGVHKGEGAKVDDRPLIVLKEQEKEGSSRVVLNRVRHQTPQPVTGGSRSVTYSTKFTLNASSVFSLHLSLIFPGGINTYKNSTKFEYTFGNCL